MNKNARTGLPLFLGEMCAFHHRMICVREREREFFDKFPLKRGGVVLSECLLPLWRRRKRTDILFIYSLYNNIIVSKKTLQKHRYSSSDVIYERGEESQRGSLFFQFVSNDGELVGDAGNSPNRRLASEI
jgi:hypothetical protein